jgi:hypothetical protein
MDAGGHVLDPVVRRAMAKDPADRFPSAGDVGRAAVAAARGEAVTEPEHIVASGEAAPLPETVRLPRQRGRRRRRLITLICVLIGLGALGAVAVIEAPKLSDGGGSSAKSSPERAVSVPDLAGIPLDQAEARLDDLGLGHSESGGGLFGVIVPSDWNVCDTAPPAGATVRRGSTVELSIDRPGIC